MPRAKSESDFDELDEDAENTAEDPNVFKIREPLDPPHTTTRSVLDLFSNLAT